MIPIKTKEEIKVMKEGVKRLRRILRRVLNKAKPGIRLSQLDKLAESLIEKQKGLPSFKMVPGYKWATCINVNQGVVHGIPDNYRLKENDVISIDMGMKFGRLNVDEAWTVLAQSAKCPAGGGVNSVQSEEKKKFLEAGEKALKAAIKAAKAGNRVGHISLAIEKEIKKSGFSPIQALTGHGVGRKLHEEPKIPCYLQEKIVVTPLLKPGMTLAIEVIYSKGSPELILKNDGWTLETADGSLAALFEKTVFVPPPPRLRRG